jgi:ATP-binding cassette subfamily G (WHITE) protein 2 (SNQ2)
MHAYSLSLAGALKWITYLNPLRWAFEAVMTNEFHTIHGECATIVPRGADYNNFSVANKVCTVVGSVPGQALVSGERFVELSFAYNQSNLWRVCLYLRVLIASYQYFNRTNVLCRTLVSVLLTESCLRRSF